MNIFKNEMLLKELTSTFLARVRTYIGELLFREFVVLKAQLIIEEVFS